MTAAADRRTADQIERDIELTRRELGDTAAALAAKADVKARAQDRLDAAKARLRGTRETVVGKAHETTPGSAGDRAHAAKAAVRSNPVPVAVVGALAAGVALGWRLGRRG